MTNKISEYMNNLVPMVVEQSNKGERAYNSSLASKKRKEIRELKKLRLEKKYKELRKARKNKK